MRFPFASSLALRLASALIAATFLTTASVLAGIYYFSVRLPMNGVRSEIAKEADGLGALYEREGAKALEAALIARRQKPSPSKAFDAFLDRDGKLLTGNFPSWPSTRRGPWVSIEADLYRDGDEDDHEALSRDALLPDGRRLIVGRDVEILADREELMVEAILWGSMSVLIFGIFGGLIISWITARRLGAVATTARAVMAGDLSVRVPARENGDEFDRLGLTLNAMLDRNVELIASVARVSSNVAHELRTPLARLRAALDARDSSGDIRQEQAEVARNEATRLQQIFDALLKIARLNTGGHRISFERFKLDALVDDAVEYYSPEAEAKSQSLSVSTGPCFIMGDRNLIFQAVTNLLDNAIKFAPLGSAIHVDLEINGLIARLTVTNDGPVVDQDSRLRLTERFFRGPGSETKSGTGLGLSLVEAIADAHGGTLTFPESESRFVAALSLPLTE